MIERSLEKFVLHVTTAKKKGEEVVGKEEEAKRIKISERSREKTPTRTRGCCEHDRPRREKKVLGPEEDREDWWNVHRSITSKNGCDERSVRLTAALTTRDFHLCASDLITHAEEILQQQKQSLSR